MSFSRYCINDRMRQFRWFLLTIPREEWTPCLPTGVTYLRGQPELGVSGYCHWQVLAYFASKVSLSAAKRSFPTTAHLEPSRSEAAAAYVWKEDTRDGEPFEFGIQPICRNRAADWERVKSLAKQGDLESIPADLYVRYYRTLVCIAADHDRPVAIEKVVYVFVGPTGTGKSRRAWSEAGDQAYAKDPRSKFWCGYKDEKNVIIDEFRGGIDISHLLRWLDRYPVRVEVKGSSRPLCAERVWITSNLAPERWYPDLDSATLDALLRRLNVEFFQ